MTTKQTKQSKGNGNTTSLQIWGVNLELKWRFKRRLFDNKETMKDVIIKFLEDYVKEPSEVPSEDPPTECG